MQGIQPDNSEPLPLQPTSRGMASIMIRFVGLLIVSVGILTLIWSR